MTLTEKRDAILSSLRSQFKTKVVDVKFGRLYSELVGETAKVCGVPEPTDAHRLDIFLLDLANNAAMGLDE